MVGYAASFTNVIAVAIANVCAGRATQIRDWRITFRFTSAIALVFALTMAILDSASFQNKSFIVGVLAGISGGLGIPLAYKAFANGPIAYVSPLLSVVQTSVIVLFATFMGESLTVILFLAFVLGIIGVYLAGKPKTSEKFDLLKISGITILAALFFSGFAIGMTQIEEGQSITGLTGARIGVFIVALAMIPVKSASHSPRPQKLWLIFSFLSALTEFVANYSYVLAIANLDLVKVGIIMSTSSIFTTLVAIPILKQKPRLLNWLGVIVATFSLVLVAIS
jgi:drug/metabolite transporter (DMT)-like permease